jgi:hypothetical protein
MYGVLSALYVDAIYVLRNCSGDVEVPYVVSVFIAKRLCYLCVRNKRLALL